MGKNRITTMFQRITSRIESFLSFKSSAAPQAAHGHLFFWMPAILGSFAAVLLFNYAERERAGTLIMVSIVMFASIATGWLLHRSHIHTIKHLLQNQKKINLNNTSFYNRVLPVWSKQINTSHQTGNSAIANLTVLFGDIVSKLETMLKMSKRNTHTGKDHEKSFLEAITSGQTDIQSVFKDLKTALETVGDSKDMLLAEVTMYSANMKDMADEAKQVAFLSQIIALNAEIEAARAGEAGRAFAAVVSEMRQLAYKSAETSSKMTKKAESIDAAMSRFYGEDEEMSAIEAEHVSRAETMLNELVERFNKITLDMEESINTMESESRQIRDDISSALVALQFQDRVSQVMAHVADNIKTLNEQLTDTGAQHLDADAWLSEMENHFTADEERTNLSNTKTSSENSSLLTFFRE